MRPLSQLEQQKGAANIEFALCLSLILLIIVGISALSAYIWAQQKMSYATGEGTRALSITYHSHAPKLNQAGSCELIKNDVSLCEQALTASGFLEPHSTCTIELNTCVPISRPLLSEWAMCTYTLSLTYDTSSNPLIHTLTQLRSLLDSSGHISSTLRAASSVNTICLPSENQYD